MGYVSFSSCKTTKLEALMGHKSLQRVYDKPDEEELLEEYVKAVDLLTINDENRLKAKRLSKKTKIG